MEYSYNMDSLENKLEEVRAIRKKLIKVHELLHVRYPNKDEDWINEKTKKLLDE